MGGHQMEAPMQHRRRKYLGLFGLITIMTLLVFVAWYRVSRPTVSLESLRRIDIGMRESEVRALLGDPDTRFPSRDARQRTYMWDPDYYCVIITFDQEGEVIAHSWDGQPPSWWDRLRRRLGY